MTRRELDFCKTLRSATIDEIGTIGLSFFFIRYDIITPMIRRSQLTETELNKYGLRSNYYRKLNPETDRQYQDYESFLLTHLDFIFLKKSTGRPLA